MRRALTALAAVVLAAGAHAHDGPPYPVLVDEEVGGRLLSLWADPDVGAGTFYLYLPDEEARPDSALTVRLEARPQDGGPGEISVEAERAAEGRPYQRIALMDFPRRGPWNVRVVLESAQGTSAVATEVDVTPSGLGKIELFWFSAPFLLIGFVWLKALQRRRAHSAAVSR